MSDSELLDHQFQQAVAAIDSGDIMALERLLAAHPRLASERLTAPGEWLRAQVGKALDGFFGTPYLLWFVAEDPVRTGRLSPAIIDIIRVIVQAARDRGAPNLQEQLDETLRLVAWSSVAAQCGVQLDMIDVLVDAGASPARNANNALVNHHIAAAERLIARGGILTLAAALCLDRLDDADRLLAHATAGQRQFAFVLAALNGKAKALDWMLRRGIDVNEPSADLYSHGTPLHHAVCSGSLDAVKVLVDAGADLNRLDTAWHGTALGWAQHYVESTDAAQKPQFEAISAYLRARETAS